MLAVLNVSSDAVAVVHLQSNCRQASRPIQPPSPLPQTRQPLAEIQRTSGPFTAPLNTQCLSGTLFGNRSINSLLWGKPQRTGVPGHASTHPLFLSWRAHGVFSGQIRIWMRVNMCTRGLGDGIRVLTTYGLASLSTVPAVSTGTIGSIL